MKKAVGKFKDISFSGLKTEISWLWKYVGKYRLYVAVYVAVGFVSTVFGLGGSVLSKKLINAVTGTEISSVVSLAVGYAAFGLTNVGLNALLSRLSAVSSAKVTQSIRRDVFGKTLRASWQELSAFHSGDMLNRVNSDVSTVSSWVLTWIPQLVTKLFQFVCAFFLILYYDKTMALIALVGSPATVLASSFFVVKLRERTQRVRSASSELVSFLGETFRGMHNIKAFDMKENFERRFRFVQGVMTEALLSQNKFSVLAGAVVSLFGLLVSYACFGWAVYRLWAGKIDFGTMALFLQLANVLSGSFGTIVSLIPGAVGSVVAARRLIELTELESEQRDALPVEGMLESNRRAGIKISLRDVRFSYKPDKEVLSGFCAEAYPGEIVALVGPSGSGKTTLLRILLGLVAPTGGAAEIVGMRTGERLPVCAATRRAFAYVPQGHSLFSGSIAENMRMAKPDASESEINEALETACALDFVSALPRGMHTVLGEDNFGLSEGQAQRIAVARAVLSDSPVILFDESTSAIDLKTEKKLLNNILSLSKKKTCVITTHKQSVMDVCTRIYYVRSED